MEGTLAILVYLVFGCAIIILFILGKLKILASLSLFGSAVYSFVVGLILIYDLATISNTRIKQGPDIPYFPIVIGIIIVGLAILCLFVGKLSTRSPNSLFRFRWLWLIFGEIILVVGLFFALTTIYVPKIYGYHRIPLLGLLCLFWLPCITIASFLFYKASRMNSEAYPNFMRYVVFVFTYVSFNYTLILSLILIYSAPTKISYVFWAALITLGFLPPSLVMLGIARDHLPLRVFGQSSSSPNISKDSEE